MVAIIKPFIMIFAILAGVIGVVLVAFDGDLDKLKSKIGLNKGEPKKSSKDKKNNTKENKINSKTVVRKGNSKENIKFEYSQTILDFDTIQEISSTPSPTGLIIRNNSKEYVGVIEVFGINYNLLALREREILEDSFTKLLNGIDYPIQIQIISRRIDIDRYIRNNEKRLKEISENIKKMNDRLEFLENEKDFDREEVYDLEIKIAKLKRQYEYGLKFNYYFTQRCKNKNMIERKYYIVITHSHNAKKYNEELTQEEITANAYFDISNKANSIIVALQRAKLNGQLLSGIGVADLLYTSYNKEDSSKYKLRQALTSGFSHYFTTASPVELKAIERRVKELKEIKEGIQENIA